MVHNMSAHNLLRQAETLKVSAADTAKGSAEAWMCRQSLQDVYQRMLILDLEYALDKKVEQDLWNHAFKNQITMFQSQTKDRNNPKRTEMQASLNLFLDTASGFYLQLLQELCSAFQLDLPMRKKALRYGILSEFKTSSYKMKLPKKSSCHYICQYCLVHLGDIARYRQQVEQAQTYYRHAVNVVPYNGQPYNQLAILEAARANKLATVFYYVRSIAVKHPFPVASLNLEKFYNKITNNQNEYKSKLSVSEMVSGFLQFHALLHHCTDIAGAQVLAEKLAGNLSTHIMSISFSSYQLLQMVTINLFGLYHAKRRLDTTSTSSTNQKEGEIELSKDEQRSYDVILEYTLSVFDVLLQCTPKQEVKAKEYHTLPVIKILLDWLMNETDLLTHPSIKKFPTIWPNLAKTLNTLQFVQGKNATPPNLSQYYKVPLPEDKDLQCFLPLVKAYKEMQFHKLSLEGLADTTEVMLRCQRIVEYGLVLAEDFPSLNLLNVKKYKSGRLEFSASTPHVKVMTVDAEGSGERRTVRTNVAIQAIIQSNMQKGTSGEATSPNRAKGGLLDAKILKAKPDDNVSKTADASVTANQISSQVVCDDMETRDPEVKAQSNLPTGIIYDSAAPKANASNQPKKKVGFQLDEDTEASKPQITSNRIKQLWEPNPPSSKNTTGPPKSNSKGKYTWVKPPRMQNQHQHETLEEKIDRDLSDFDIRTAQSATAQMSFSETAFGPMHFGIGSRNMGSTEKQGSFDDDRLSIGSGYGTSPQTSRIVGPAAEFNSMYGSSPQTRNAMQSEGSLSSGNERFPGMDFSSWGTTSAVGDNTPSAPGIGNMSKRVQQPNDAQTNVLDIKDSKELQKQQQQQYLEQMQRNLWQSTSQESNANNATTKNAFPSMWDSTAAQNAGQAASSQRHPLHMAFSSDQTNPTNQNQGWQRGVGNPNPLQQAPPRFDGAGMFNSIHPTLQNLFEAAQRPRAPQGPIQQPRIGNNVENQAGNASTPRMNQPIPAQQQNVQQSQQQQNMPRQQMPTNQMPPLITSNQMLRLQQLVQGLNTGNVNGVGGNASAQMPRMPNNEQIAAIRLAQLHQRAGMPPQGDRNPAQAFFENQQQLMRQRAPFNSSGNADKNSFGLGQDFNRMTTDENLRSQDNNIGSPYNKKYSSNNPALDLGLSFPFKDVPKPDSPVTEGGSFFTTSPEKSSAFGTPNSGTYSLFSQSTWNTPLSKNDVNSHNSSPFNSSSASNRTSPDPFSAPQDERSPHHQNPLAMGFNMRAPAPENGGWSVSANQNMQAPVMPQNQGMWTAGPSPLEKLLEKQRQQKSDPH